MKKSQLLSSLLTATLLLATACTKSQVHPKEDIDKKINEIIEKAKLDNAYTDKLIEDILKNSTNGGQPGSITLNGVISIDGEKLDSRISVSQEAGLSQTGSATTLTKQELLALNKLETAKLEEIRVDLKKRETEQKTYINLGCELAESEIAGLTEVSSKNELEKDIATLSTTRLFICGELNLEKIVVSISASEIMLKDATINQSKSLGSLSLTTGTLVLVGKNKMRSLGENGSGLLLSAASINLTVTNEIYGDGELSIESKGGNNIAEKKP